MKINLPDQLLLRGCVNGELMIVRIFLMRVGREPLLLFDGVRIFGRHLGASQQLTSAKTVICFEAWSRWTDLDAGVV